MAKEQTLWVKCLRGVRIGGEHRSPEDDPFPLGARLAKELAAAGRVKVVPPPRMTRESSKTAA